MKCFKKTITYKISVEKYLLILPLEKPMFKAQFKDRTFIIINYFERL